MQKPVVMLSSCIKCGSCVETSPETFKMDRTGLVEVEDLDVYPKDEIDDAIRWCPEHCIFWVTDNRLATHA